jgi:dipeptide transport system substrate-binding protein
MFGTSLRLQRVEKMRARRFLFLVALPIALAMPIPSEAKTLVYCAEASPDTFDPALATGVRDASATAIYNRLVEFEPGSTTVGPGLAERWEVTPDGLEYTFHLRKRIRFHSTEDFVPTRDLSADDVIFTFDRQLNPSSPYHNYAERPYSYFESVGMPKLIKAWEKTDDHTIKLVLHSPHAPMIPNLAMDFSSVMSKEYADKRLSRSALAPSASSTISQTQPSATKQMTTTGGAGQK